MTIHSAIMTDTNNNNEQTYQCLECAWIGVLQHGGGQPPELVTIQRGDVHAYLHKFTSMGHVRFDAEIGWRS